MGRRAKKRRVAQQTAAVLDAYQRVTAEMPTIDPQCPHFGTCGGCNLQHLAYSNQAQAKRAVLIDLARDRGLDQDADLDQVAVVASEQAFGYRQRMDFVHLPAGTGLRQAGRFRSVVPIEQCPLLGARGVAALHAGRDLAAAQDSLPPYDIMTHEGVLRYIVIRRNRQDQIMMNIVTTSAAPADQVATIAQAVLDQGIAESVHWLHHDGLGDTSFGQEHAHWGLATLPECIHHLQFELGPNTFFQANPAIAEQAYSQMQQWLAGSQHGLDLYTGTGTIACLLAQVCDQVTAVEMDPANVALAEHNLERNGISNVSLHRADVTAWVSEWTGTTDAMVLNPPRAGVGQAACQQVLRLAPQRLAYMSCNPLSLLSDWQHIRAHYEIAAITVYDMFPQTRHFETVICCQRRTA